ncbi:MAG: response regulator [Hyphomonadaceae bacterium]|nr:response regulator [Hyphomonadaceae bacterium]
MISAAKISGAMNLIDAFEAAPDPAAHLDAEGVVIDGNAAFRQVFRHAVGSPRPPWGRVQPPAFVGDMRRFDAPAPDGRVYEWSERRLPDGSRIAAARDVTERVQAATEADRAKTLLFATLTHELRTPLNGILGMAGLLGQSKLEPEARDHLRIVRQSGEHLLDLINEILDYSRLEAGKLALDSAPFEPEATAQSVAEMLSPKAREKGLEIAVAARPSAPACVTGDEGRFRQILFNLAGNAVKFTETGGVSIELFAANTPGGGLRLVVRDTGPGIPAEKQAQIFEEFTQADSSVSRLHGGAGLGLAIVRKLAHVMGGRVGLDSRPGRGAAFWVELPLAPAPSRRAPARLEGLRMALISPSEVLARALTAAIVGLGGDMVTLSGAEQAMKFDVVLVDHASALTPAQFAALIASGQGVVALVPQEERDAITMYRDAGVEHYVVKPVRRASLAERLLLAAGRGKADARAGAPTEDDRAQAPLSLAGLRVLLAEDNPINALLARTLLTRAGCVVDVASDGEEAIEAAARAPYDLIFLDLRMPRMDGAATARWVRSHPGPSAEAAIVALTAEAGEAAREAALKAGMDGFLTKPIDPTQLAAVAARFTQRARAANVARV